MTLSLIARLRALPAEERRAVLADCTSRELAALRWCWRAWARPDERDPERPHLGRGQLPPPGDWTWWTLLGGRAAGKTRACAEWVTDHAVRLGEGFHIHLVARTPKDGLATMIRGDKSWSSLSECCPPWVTFTWQSGAEGADIQWSTGATGRLFGANVVGQGRGPACCAMWVDDPAAFGPKGLEVLNILKAGMRNRMPDGSDPRGIVSSTDIDTDLMDDILAGEDGSRAGVVYSYGVSEDNAANVARTLFTETFANMDPALAEQERTGRRMRRGGGSPFRDVTFAHVESPEPLIDLGVWIDPSVSDNDTACEVGVVAVGMDGAGVVYGLADKSAVMSAKVWPGVAVELLEELAVLHPHARLHLGVETNKGGNMPAELLRLTEQLRRAARNEGAFNHYEVREVRAMPGQSKTKRAEPAAVRSKATPPRLRMLPGLAALERQLHRLSDTGGGNDAADAFVHGVNSLSPLDAPGGSVVWTPSAPAIEGRYAHSDPRRSIQERLAGRRQGW